MLDPRPGDADQLANFLIDLQRLREADGARDLRGASAAIYSPAEAIAQFEQRLQRLVPEVGRYPELREFIDHHLAPSAELVRRRLEARYKSLGWDPGVKLAPTYRALSPSISGLHNALRGQDGQLRFIDFEYFGWDDPVKLVCDTALHPGSGFPESVAKRLVERLSPVFAAQDPTFAVRRALLYPVFGLIWCLIILNDYLPASRSRRVMAGRGGELGAILAGQLDKARRLHQAICHIDPDLTPR